MMVDVIPMTATTASGSQTRMLVHNSFTVSCLRSVVVLNLNRLLNIEIYFLLNTEMLPEEYEYILLPPIATSRLRSAILYGDVANNWPLSHM